MKDLLKRTAYLGLGIAASIGEKTKANLEQLASQTISYSQKGEEDIKRFSEQFTFTLTSDFALDELDLIADIQY